MICLGLRRRRSVYVWPHPTKTMGAPEMYTMDSAAPTCNPREANKRDPNIEGQEHQKLSCTLPAIHLKQVSAHSS